MVIDDEPLAIQLLANHISKVTFLELASTFNNPMEGLMFQLQSCRSYFFGYSNAPVDGYPVHEVIAKPGPGYYIFGL
jgi:hypothetical protein